MLCFMESAFHTSPYKKAVLFFITLSVVMGFASCSGPQRGLFGSRSPHEKYADKINEAGLAATELGRSWLSAATKGLQQPLVVNLPYKETGYFPASTPGAEGYRFSARRGDQLIIEIAKKPVTGFKIFMDLWQPAANNQPELLMSSDTTGIPLQYEIKKDGDYLLRLQPELLAGGEYTLTIRTAPSLAFPVQTSANPRIGSFWGDARDAGARSHEGIDIFSPKRTPAVAAADGRIRSVGTNALGGKIIFLNPSDRNYALYYAHLDTQLVEEGQRVKAGDIIGLVGNTGNARNTPPHLHFGIYSSGGAVDPLPFVKRDRPGPVAITAAAANINAYVRSDRNTVIYSAPDRKSAKLVSPEASTLLQVKAATGDWYKVRLPDGQEGFITDESIARLDKPIRNYALSAPTRLLDKPDSMAAAKTVIEKGGQVQVLASFNDYYYVQHGAATGWIAK
jgi:peptidoglycan LD-endopeptidase LytH